MNPIQSFASRLSLKLLVSTVLIYLAAIAVLAVASYNIVSDDVKEDIMGELQKSNLRLEQTLDEVECASRSLIWLIGEHKDDPEYMYKISMNLVEISDDIVGSTIAFIPDYYPEKGTWWAPYSYKDEATGQIISFQMGGEDYKYHDMEWFTAPMLSKQSCWSPPYYDDGGGQQVMTTYSIPIFDENGDAYAVFTADINLNSLTEYMDDVKPYEHAYAILVDQSGQFICHPDKSRILKDNIMDEAEAFGEKQLNNISKAIDERNYGFDKFRDARGRESFIVFGPLSNGWTAAIISPSRDAFASLSNIKLLFSLMTLLGLLLIFFVSRKIIERQSIPITEFANSAMSIAQGNFHASIPEVSSRDELKRLHDALMYMQNSINSYISELRRTTNSNERYESELNIASGIQNDMLLHSFEKHDLFDVQAMLQPAKEVGGDLYDFFHKGNKIYFAIGDVSGKGVPAALYMAITRSAFRFIAGLGLSEDKIMYSINNAFAEGNKTGMFVTMFVASIDLDTLEMHFCNAGHNPIVIKHPDGKTEYLRAKPNVAAGLFEDFNYESESLRLEKGCRLLLYTDGVSEAENANKELFGEERLLDFASKNDGSSQEFLDKLMESLKDFTKDCEQNDDITVMSIKF